MLIYILVSRKGLHHLNWLSIIAPFIFAFLASNPASSCSCLLLMPLRSSCFSITLATPLTSTVPSPSSVVDAVTELNLPVFCSFGHHRLPSSSCFWVYICVFPKPWPNLTAAPSAMKSHRSILWLGTSGRVAVHTLHTSSSTVIQCLLLSEDK